MRCLFEVQDLSVASPATVSRCGMVFLSNELGYLPYVRSWLPKFEQMSSELQAHLLKLFEEKLVAGINWKAENGKEPIPTSDIQVAASLCSLFEALFTSENGVDLADSFDDLKLTVELVFAFSFAWAVGGSLEGDSAKQFNKLCMELFVNIRPPVSVFDSYVDVREKSWKSWDALVPAFDFDPKGASSFQMVPTIDTLRYQTLLDTLLGVEKAVFFTGLSGVGKTSIILDLFNGSTKESAKRLSPLFLTFSAQTNAKKTQETIEGKLVKYRKTLLGSPAGKQTIVFVDDGQWTQQQQQQQQVAPMMIRCAHSPSVCLCFAQ